MTLQLLIAQFLLPPLPLVLIILDFGSGVSFFDKSLVTASKSFRPFQMASFARMGAKTTELHTGIPNGPKNNGVAHRDSKWPPKTIAAPLEIAKCTDSEVVSAARMYSHRTNRHHEADAGLLNDDDDVCIRTHCRNPLHGGVA